MSQTYIGIIVMFLSAMLPKIGVTLGNDELTTAASVILTIGGALWAAYGRFRVGGITVFGKRI